MPQSKKKNRKNHFVAVEVSTKKSECIFCNRSTNDEIIFGKLFNIGNIASHYFCALLSSCLIQCGEDDEGLFGFLYEDIVAEAQRGKRYKCSYCSRGGATLGCTVPQCKKQFHLPCGRERNAVSMFFGNYKSYCEKHAPKQNIPEKIMVKANHRLKVANRQKRKLYDKRKASSADVNDEVCEEVVCVICYEPVPGYPCPETFWPSCCRKDAWFHRNCLQRMALASGMHYLKCPLCNDKKDFYQAVVEQGYYVPDRDAAWELEANAFAEIYERPAQCDAQDCRCTLGRDHDEETGLWELKLCLLCGSSCVHKGCLPDLHNVHYVCNLCEAVTPPDLDKLAAAAVIATQPQQESSPQRRRGTPVPARMSLRRTKHAASSCRMSTNEFSTPEKTQSRKYNVGDAPQPSSSEQRVCKVVSFKLDLDFTTPNVVYAPKNIEEMPLKDLSNVYSPMKIVEDSLKSKIMQMDVQDMSVFDTKNLIEKVREKFKKPRPLSVKRKIVSVILEDLMSNTCLNAKNHSEVPTLEEEDSSKSVQNMDTNTEVLYQGINKENVSEEKPESDSNQTLQNEAGATSTLCIEDDVNNKTENTNVDDEDTKSTFELPPEFVADYNSDDFEICDTPKKLKTVSIDDSTIEISEKNEGINIDVVKIETNKCDTKLQIKYRKDPKCSFKFSPIDKETLQDENLDIDLEVFKNQYLTEVDRRSYKCAFSHEHEEEKAASTKYTTAIDFAIDAVKKKYSESIEYQKENPDIRKTDESKKSDNELKHKLSLNRNNAIKKRRLSESENSVINDREGPPEICDSVKLSFIEEKLTEPGHAKRPRHDSNAEENYLNNEIIVIDDDSTEIISEVSHISRKVKPKRRKIVKKIKHTLHQDATVLKLEKFKRLNSSQRINIGKSQNINKQAKKIKIKFKKQSNFRSIKILKKPNIDVDKVLKQTVLTFGTNNKILTKLNIKPKKIEKNKNNLKSPDNLKQMSLDNFFVLKISD